MGDHKVETLDRVHVLGKHATIATPPAGHPQPYTTLPLPQTQWRETCRTQLLITAPLSLLWQLIHDQPAHQPLQLQAFSLLAMEKDIAMTELTTRLEEASGSTGSQARVQEEVQQLQQQVRSRV